MEDEKEEKLTPYILADRNEILVKYANFSFRKLCQKSIKRLKQKKNAQEG